jgi:RNA polymerase sigma-70 factor, ECF subfamily
MVEDGRKETPLNAAAQDTSAARSGHPPVTSAGAPGGAVDPRALEAVFREHGSDVIRTAYRVTGSMSDAEDVLQTVFLRLAGREEPLDVEGLGDAAGAYLRRAAVNAALDVVRGRKRRRALPLDAEDAPEPADEAADPERRRSGREAGARLRAALSVLEPKAARIFALRYFEEMGNKEIAHVLAMSQTAVAVTLHRSRSRLRREIGSPVGGLS